MGLKLFGNESTQRYVHPDFYELQRYLGISFNLNWCNALDKKGEEEANSDKYTDSDEFSRRTLVYCYQNIGLQFAGIHRAYIAKILENSAGRGPLTLIDVGAGGGQVGLAFHTLGFNVSFADIYGQSLLWLLWRLKERRLELPVYVLDEPFEEKVPKSDVAICFDVIEHIKPEEQTKFLSRLANMGNAVFVNLIRGDGTELPGLHSAVDADYLTEYCLEHWPCWAKDYYPNDEGVFRQRLLIYGAGVTLSEKDYVPR